MFTQFQILSGATVPSNYSWDQGTPFTNVNTSVSTTNSLYISGYAPGLKVTFKNNSITDPKTSYTRFDWNFGDYYNNTSNSISLNCNQNLEHIYVMPGIYNVTLNHNQTKTKQDFNYVENANYCIGKFDFLWFWDNMSCLSGDSMTWDETSCNAEYAKWWDKEELCFGKFCKIWNWLDLRSKTNQGTTPITWEQTYTGAQYEKKWAIELNSTICNPRIDMTYINTLVTEEQTYTITNTVEVFEIKPKAYLYSYTQPVTGYTPFSVHLTPRFTVSGSFAIEKIDWDFGDGTPIQTVWRRQPPDLTLFTYTSTFSADVNDPRNYDTIHTYKRALNTYPVFYPSITAYSGSTNSSDACSLLVGPISLSSISSKIHILKSKAQTNNNFYALQVDKNTTFVTTQTSDSSKPYLPTIPNNPIKPIESPLPLTYKGNLGNNYPPPYNPQC
jgi:hypothetical protein